MYRPGNPSKPDYDRTMHRTEAYARLHCFGGWSTRSLVRFDSDRISQSIFYLFMYIVIHSGVYEHFHHQLGAKGWILVTTIALNLLILGVLTMLILSSDPVIVLAAVVGIAAVCAYERVYLDRWIDVDHESASAS